MESILVAPELGAHGALRAGGKDVKNTAAARKLAGALHHVAAAVAAREQARLERFGALALAETERKGGVFQNIRRQRALQKAGNGAYRDERAGIERVERAQPPLLLLPGYDLDITQREIPPRELHNALAEQRLKIGGERSGVRLVGAENEDGPVGLAAEHRRAESAHRAARLGQKGRQIALLDPQGEGSKGGCFSYGFDYGVHKYREYTFIVSFARKKPPQNVGRSEPLSHGCAVPAPPFGEPSPLSEIFPASPIEGRWVLPQGFRGLLYD